MKIAIPISSLLVHRNAVTLEWVEHEEGVASDGSDATATITKRATIEDCLKLQRYLDACAVHPEIREDTDVLFAFIELWKPEINIPEHIITPRDKLMLN